MTEGVSSRSRANRIRGSNGDEYLEEMRVAAEGSISILVNAK